MVPTSLAKLSTLAKHSTKAISLHSNTNMCLKKDVTVPVVPTALTKLIAITAITLYNNTNTKKYLKKDIIVPQSRDAYL